MAVAAAPTTGGYPADVTYAMGDLSRSRVSVFFRWLLAIPNIVMLYIWGIGFALTTFLAWFAVLFTGKYPPGLYGFGVSYMRMAADSFAYLHYVTDEYPPWSGNDQKAATYPVQYSIVYSGSSNRLTVFFRYLLAIPAMIFVMLVYIAAGICVFFAWWAIMFTGKFPQGMLSFVQGALRSYMRIASYLYFMTDQYPPFSLQ